MNRLSKSMLNKGLRIHKLKITGSAKKTRYADTLSVDEVGVLEYALSLGYITEGNDAPRGGKIGNYYEVIKPFDFEKLKKRYDLYRAI